MPSRFWIRLLDAPGSWDRESLVVLTTDGRVLGRVEGDRDTVAFPGTLDELLDAGQDRLVLAHTHPANTSLSGADLCVLLRRGVERVVAIGGDGSVYEATTGRRTVTRVTGARLFADVEARVRERLPIEAARAGAPPGAGFEFFSHLVASAFARAGVITYRVQMSATLVSRYVLDARWLDGIIATEASRLVALLPQNP